MNECLNLHKDYFVCYVSRNEEDILYAKFFPETVKGTINKNCVHFLCMQFMLDMFHIIIFLSKLCSFSVHAIYAGYVFVSLNLKSLSQNSWSVYLVIFLYYDQY